ncbi:MAG: class I SAM-dependent methyltransferase [Bacteroidia bacterium]|nr:class I SAM-dependent methyltransferase [Bacteroidia bacterium]
MDISDIIVNTQQPELYEAGTAFMWTDEHISKQLLKVHLNPEVDLASRKQTNIEKTVEWILNNQKDNDQLSILDLGCGPGLYTEIFAQKGHRVTGVDISNNSIEYAKKSATQKDLDIHYINSSYLNLNLEANTYDLIILIYTDLGVLTPPDRNEVLKTVYRALKPGGMFLFDVLKDQRIEEKVSPRTWDANDGGFWRASPYLVLSESFLYEKERVILFQHTVVDDNDKLETYRFWTHFFSEEAVVEMLSGHNFRNIQFREDILPEGDMWNGDNVLFVSTSK